MLKKPEEDEFANQACSSAPEDQSFLFLLGENEVSEESKSKLSADQKL